MPYRAEKRCSILSLCSVLKEGENEFESAVSVISGLMSPHFNKIILLSYNGWLVGFLPDVFPGFSIFTPYIVEYNKSSE